MPFPASAGPPFVTEVTLEEDRTTVRAFGILDEATAIVLDECLARLRIEGAGTIELDLRGILYADGSAAESLDAWAIRADDETDDLSLTLPLLQSRN